MPTTDKSIVALFRSILPVLGVLALACLLLGVGIPYMHDDWDWGLDVGMNEFLNATINNRLCGNACVVAMTRLPWLKCIGIGLGVFATVVLMATLAWKNADAAHDRTSFVIYLLLSVLALASMPFYIWRESIGWVAGFANYGVSMVLLLVYFIFLRRVLSPGGDPYPSNPLAWVGLFALCVALQLFLENLTVVLLALSICVLLYNRITRGRFYAADFVMIAAFAVGTYLMFRSSVYTELTTTGQSQAGFRQMSFSTDDGLPAIVSGLVSVYFGKDCFNYLYCSNPIIMMALLFVAGWALRRSSLGGSRRNIVFIGYCLFSCLFFFFLALCAAQRILDVSVVTAPIMTVCNLVFFVVVLMILVRTVSEERLWMAFLWVAGPVFLLPLSALSNGYGDRMFYPTTVLLALFGISWVALLIKNSAQENSDRCTSIAKKAVKVLSVLCLLFAVKYAVIYTGIQTVTAQRAELFEQARQQGLPASGVMELPSLPFQDYLKVPDPHPSDTYRFTNYNSFVHAPEGVVDYTYYQTPWPKTWYGPLTD